MKKLVVGMLVALAGISCAQDLKGVRIGMTKAEYDKAMETAGYFTIGGVSPKYSVSPEFDEQEKLTRFTFFFRSEDYAEVREAVKSKYPKLKCIQTSVGNRMGATFAQEHCMLGTLLLSRFVSDIETGVLSLSAPESQKAKSEREKKKKDI